MLNYFQNIIILFEKVLGRFTFAEKSEKFKIRSDGRWSPGKMIKNSADLAALYAATMLHFRFDILRSDKESIYLFANIKFM